MYFAQVRLFSSGVSSSNACYLQRASSLSAWPVSDAVTSSVVLSDVPVDTAYPLCSYVRSYVYTSCQVVSDYWLSWCCCLQLRGLDDSTSQLACYMIQTCLWYSDVCYPNSQLGMSAFCTTTWSCCILLYCCESYGICSSFFHRRQSHFLLSRSKTISERA
jgi:hypothetical protein